MINQLTQICAKISLPSLNINSKPHKKILLKILNKAHVIHNVSMEKFEGIIGNITTNNYPTFY